MNNSNTHFFISIYTDQQAIDDGTLIDISPLNLHFKEMPINRITANLYHQLKAFLISTKLIDRLLEFKKLLVTKLELAFYKGDIWHLPPNLWLIENELDGWTLMLPDDY